jgi:hypothetical protein
MDREGGEHVSVTMRDLRQALKWLMIATGHRKDYSLEEWEDEDRYRLVRDHGSRCVSQGGRLTKEQLYEWIDAYTEGVYAGLWVCREEVIDGSR